MLVDKLLNNNGIKYGIENIINKNKKEINFFKFLYELWKFDI